MPAGAGSDAYEDPVSIDGLEPRGGVAGQPTGVMIQAIGRLVASQIYYQRSRLSVSICVPPWLRILLVAGGRAFRAFLGGEVNSIF